MSLELDGSYKGANPSDPARIHQLGPNRFRVHPYSEDGDGNYKFALSVRVINHAPEPQPLSLEVDWEDLQYMGARRFFHVGRGDDWQFLPAEVEGTVARVRYDAPPGTSYVGLCPSYFLGDYEVFAARLPQLGYERRVAGHSEQGRDIEAFSLGQGPTPVLVTGRFHPYETASSFCLEGLMEWLASPAGRELRERFTFTIVPMMNPDGVSLGLCKRTSQGGVDLEHEGAYGGDSTARALLDLMEEVAPAGFLDIHGWMHFDEDGAFYLDKGLVERFQRELESSPVFAGNRLKTIDVSGQPYPGWPQTYCARRYGAHALEVSYRWPSRTVAMMRATGGPTLLAFCRALEAVR
ncbi:MAG: M14 family zinc carboxypeptidase [Anaerolineae bacterium]